MTVWTDHVKSFAKKNGLSYGCALNNPECSASYKSKKIVYKGKGPSLPVKKYKKM